MSFLPVLVAFLVASFSAPLIYRALLRTNSRQTISQHIQEHAHKQGTPTMGGLIILVGLLAGCLSAVAAALPQGQETFNGVVNALTPFLIILVGFGLVGFIDDFVIPRRVAGKRGLSWIPKLLLQLAVPILACLSTGVTSWLTIALVTFIILFFANAYNFSDGLDMLAGGLCVLLALGFAFLSRLPLFGGNFEAHGMVMIMLVSATLPFLIYNAPPAKVFMGDVGSLPIGGCLGWMFAILLLGNTQASVGSPTLQWDIVVPLLILSFVMILELVPVPIQILWVKLFKRRAFNFKTPIHHAFQERGWPEPKIVRLFHLVQLICVVVSIGIASRGVNL
ncbi:hypothetical protein QPK87_19890 [Kamptonema cortianum]|nr:hypothetical protein [Geitlerinema splendidum]MDK3158820.1 hypothetical protein [Kamptonema cortianum]